MNKLFENWRRYLTEAHESSYHLSNAPEGKEQDLTNLLNKEGLLDNKTKKTFENIDKGIQFLVNESRKKHENQEVKQASLDL